MMAPLMPKIGKQMQMHNSKSFQLVLIKLFGTTPTDKNTSASTTKASSNATQSTKTRLPYGHLLIFEIKFDYFNFFMLNSKIN